VAIASAAWALAMPTAAALGQRPILVVGDSLSAEYGLVRGSGWVALLDQRLAREQIGAEVVNASISGDTTSGRLARLPTLLREHKPGLVILELGGNDALRGLPLAQMKSNLAAIVERSKKSGARVLLVGMKMPPNFGADYMAAFEKTFDDVASGQRVALVPFMLEGFAQELDYFQPDRIHPNERAQPLILQTIWPKLAPLLK
jgi:acyl-CoA thioesterase-1